MGFRATIDHDHGNSNANKNIVTHDGKRGYIEQIIATRHAMTESTFSLR